MSKDCTRSWSVCSAWHSAQSNHFLPVPSQHLLLVARRTSLEWGRHTAGRADGYLSVQDVFAAGSSAIGHQQSACNGWRAHHMAALCEGRSLVCPRMRRRETGRTRLAGLGWRPAWWSCSLRRKYGGEWRPWATCHVMSGTRPGQPNTQTSDCPLSSHFRCLSRPSTHVQLRPPPPPPPAVLVCSPCPPPRSLHAPHACCPPSPTPALLGFPVGRSSQQAQNTRRPIRRPSVLLARPLHVALGCLKHFWPSSLAPPPAALNGKRPMVADEAL